MFFFVPTSKVCDAISQPKPKCQTLPSPRVARLQHGRLVRLVELGVPQRPQPLLPPGLGEPARVGRQQDGPEGRCGRRGPLAAPSRQQGHPGHCGRRRAAPRRRRRRAGRRRGAAGRREKAPPPPPSPPPGRQAAQGVARRQAAAPQGSQAILTALHGRHGTHRSIDFFIIIIIDYGITVMFLNEIFSALLAARHRYLKKTRIHTKGHGGAPSRKSWLTSLALFPSPNAYSY